MLCICMGHTHEEVERMMKEGNYKTLDEFREDTFVGMGCGGCLPVLDEMFAKMKAND